MMLNNIILLLLLILNAKYIYSYRINTYNKISSSLLKKTSSSNTDLYQLKSSNNDNISPSSTLIVNNNNDTHDKLRKWFLLNYNVRPEIYYANVKDLPTLMNVISESILLSLRVLQVLIIHHHNHRHYHHHNHHHYHHHNHYHHHHPSSS